MMRSCRAFVLASFFAAFALAGCTSSNNAKPTDKSKAGLIQAAHQLVEDSLSREVNGVYNDINKACRENLSKQDLKTQLDALGKSAHANQVKITHVRVKNFQKGKSGDVVIDFKNTDNPGSFAFIQSFGIPNSEHTWKYEDGHWRESTCSFLMLDTKSGLTQAPDATKFAYSNILSTEKISDQLLTYLVGGSEPFTGSMEIAIAKVSEKTDAYTDTFTDPSRESLFAQPLSPKGKWFIASLKVTNNTNQNVNLLAVFRDLFFATNGSETWAFNEDASSFQGFITAHGNQGIDTLGILEPGHSQNTDAVFDVPTDKTIVGFVYGVNLKGFAIPFGLPKE